MTEIERKRIEECLIYLAKCIEDGSTYQVSKSVKDVLSGSMDAELLEVKP